MNRKQVFDLEVEYIINDLKSGVREKDSLISRSKKRRLIPANIRYLWEQKCLQKAKDYLEV